MIYRPPLLLYLVIAAFIHDIHVSLWTLFLTNWEKKCFFMDQWCHSFGGELQISQNELSVSIITVKSAPRKTKIVLWIWHSWLTGTLQLHLQTLSACVWTISWLVQCLKLFSFSGFLLNFLNLHPHFEVAIKLQKLPMKLFNWCDSLHFHKN